MSGGSHPSSAQPARPASSSGIAGLQSNPNTQRARPASADWTRGHEVHMEGREPFEVWRSGLHSQIASLEKNLDNVEDELDDYESDGDSRGNSTAADNTDGEAMVRKQTDKKSASSKKS